MPYFPVDDEATFHPKFIAAGNAAVGLWTRAGSWCKKYVSGGFVPRDIAEAIGTEAQIRRLLSSGLWVKADGGFRFHDWEHQAGNFDAATEKARKESDRERARERKRNQRSRDGHKAGHAVTPPVTPSGVTPPVTGMSRTPPYPYPLTSDTQVSPVPERESYPQDGSEESIESICRRQLATQGVEFDRVRTAIGKACGRIPEPTQITRISVAILERATPPVKSPTGMVVASVKNDWAEWQKFLDEGVAS